MKKIMVIVVSVLCAFILITTVGCNDGGENPPENHIDAAAPVIIGQPQNVSLRKGETTQGLEVRAFSDDNGSLSYQWYRSEKENGDGGGLLSTAQIKAYWNLIAL